MKKDVVALVLITISTVAAQVMIVKTYEKYCRGGFRPREA